MGTLCVAFKGKGNSSNIVVSSFTGDKLFLTNSFIGLKNDIDSINNTFDLVYMFGLDKNLKGEIRIESVAVKDDVRLYSDLDLDAMKVKLKNNGISATIGNTPTNCLCNEAYWYMLKKYNNHVAFFHVPSIKYVNDVFIEKIQNALFHTFMEETAQNDFCDCRDEEGGDAVACPPTTQQVEVQTDYLANVNVLVH